MTKLLFRQLSALLLLVAPIVTMNWSILNLLGYAAGPTDPVNVKLFLIELNGPKQEVELKIRGVIILLGFTLGFLYELYDRYFPERRFYQFRSFYLNTIKTKWRQDLIPEVRISIQHAKRRWFFPFCKVLSWTWNDGFAPEDRDVNLWLTSWQGVGGRAFKRRKPVLVDLRPSSRAKLKFHEKWLLLNQFKLWPLQLTKTKEVKCVLSIPLLMETGELSKGWKSVGVLNLDTTSDVGAEFLILYSKALGDQFTDEGKIVAYLRE